MRRSTALFICSPLTLLTLAPLAGAQILTNFSPTANNEWSLLTNWSAGVPNNGGGTEYHAQILGSTCFNDSTHTVSLLTLDSTAVLRLRNTSVLNIEGDPDPLDMDFSRGRIVNQGFIESISTGSTTDIRLLNGTVSILGAGSSGLPNIQLANPNDRITGVGAGVVLVNEGGHRIFGGGQVGTNTMAIVNNGVIAANVGTMTVDPNAGGVTNNGSLRARDGATLLLTSGDILNNNVIESFSNGLVQLASVFIDGGNLVENGGDIIVTGDCTLDDGRIVGDVVVTNASILRLVTALDLEGTLNYTLTTGSTTDLRLVNDVNIVGGLVNLEGSPNNRIVGVGSGQTLTLAGATVRGGQVGANTLNIVNNGTLLADGVTQTIDPASTLTNNNLIQTVNDGVIELQPATYINNAVIDADSGEIRVNAATIQGGQLIGADGRFVSNSSSFVNLNSSARLDVLNASLANFSGGFSNSNVISLLSGGSTTDFRINSDVTLTGGGAIMTTASPNNRILATGGTFTLTNADHLISGGGQIGANTTNIVNQAVIEADGNSMSIDPASTMTNSGVIRTANGTPLTLQPGTYTNTGGMILPLDGGVTLNACTVIDGQLGDGTGAFTGTSATLQDVMLRSDLTIPNASIVNIRNAIDNTATITIASAGSTTDLRGATPVVELSGGGEILMTNVNARITAVPAGGLIDNVDHLIRGHGQIGANATNFINRSIFRAEGGAFTFDPASTFNNDGLIENGAGGGLILNGPGFDNEDGVIDAADGPVTLNSTVITGGLLTSNTGAYSSNSAQLVDLSLDADLTMPNASALIITGTVECTRRIAVVSTGSTTDLRVNGDGTTLTGVGMVDLGPGNNSRITMTPGGSTFINEAEIRGGGQIGANTGNLVNRGRIASTDPGTGLTIDPSSFFTNEGELHVLTNDVTINPGTFANSGDVIIDAGRTLSRAAGQFSTQTAGSTTVLGVLSHGGGPVILEGGVLTGDGEVVCSLLSNIGGDLQPADGVGTMIITGDYEQLAGGSLTAEVAGLTSFDQVGISGSASLAGTVNLVVNPGYMPQEGDSFRVLFCTNASGAIDAVNLVNGPATLGAAATIDALGLVITVIGICPGDATGDGLVNFDDLNLLLENWNTAVAAGEGGDVDDSGFVDFNDLNILLENWALDCN